MSEKKEIRLKDETEFFSVLKEVKKESRLQETEQYIQHGVTSVYRHS
ncbi:MAG: phosphodiesterase, partial [Lachnospiraceae bacterium]|nr:phosphodiesterase [Lachnospiraceae bacterium]